MEKATSSINATSKTLFIIIIIISAGFVSSDFNQDKKECGDQLADFSPCLPFVGGKAKSPTPTCCSNIRKQISQSRKCLCLLVKDRSDPGIGFKMNATLALSLPSLCHSPANISDCPALLNLPPNSTDAQVFKQFAASSVGSAVTGVTSSSSKTVKGRIWLGMGMGMVYKASLWLVISLLSFCMLEESHAI